MPRLRSIKPSYFTDEDIGGLSPLARLLFIALWTEADREGRLEDRPKQIKARLLPYDDVDAEPLLTELAKGRFIVRYLNGGRRFIAVRSFAKHQHVHMKEPGSTIPAPDESGSSPVQEPDGHQTGPLVSGLLSLGNGLLSLEEHPSDACAETAPKRRSTPDAPPDPLCPTFPCDGPVANWQATAAQVARWRELYPTLDLRHELLKAHTWIVDHPAKRKTARGMAGFITSWLGRATNQPRGFQPNPTLPAAPPKPPRVQTRRDLLAQEIRDAEAFKRTDRVAELRRRLAEAERNGTADEPIE